MTIVRLFVRKSFTSDAPLSRPWILAWAESLNSDTYCRAGGEINARYFHTMKAAISFGQHRYGETASRFKP